MVNFISIQQTYFTGTVFMLLEIVIAYVYGKGVYEGTWQKWNTRFLVPVKHLKPCR